MLIRDERRTALNEIIEHCREAADHYREAAGLTKDAALAELFAGIGVQREELAAGLAFHLRRLGDLPAAPDRDREAVEELATRIKTALAGNGRRQLLEERRQGEEELLSLIDAALQQDFSEEAGMALRDAREKIAAARKRLDAARAAIESPD